jgi:hypothetical protein
VGTLRDNCIAERAKAYFTNALPDCICKTQRPSLTCGDCAQKDGFARVIGCKNAMNLKGLKKQKTRDITRGFLTKHTGLF